LASEWGQTGRHKERHNEPEWWHAEIVQRQILGGSQAGWK
jgi:hypothetical protein